MIDATAQAALRAMIALLGQPVTLQRISGVAPNATVANYTVSARIRNFTPDTNEVSETGYAASQPGGVTQTDRKLILVAADVAASGFPVPVLKNDKVILPDGTKGNVTLVDSWTRALSGGIELSFAEVA